MPSLPLFDPDTFSSKVKDDLPHNAPLAARLRPKRLVDFIGQGHLKGESKMLERMIETKRLSSLIFYGPPGTGKTTLARIIAHETDCDFIEVNATESNVKELRKTLADARLRLRRSKQRSVLFVDEIHRFNKSQQDVLLPDVENGFVVLIGATTENPSFSINSPLLSRSQLFGFKSLDEIAMGAMLDRAVLDEQLRLGYDHLVIEPEARLHLMARSDGDARRLLNGLEMAVLVASRDEGQITVTLKSVEQAIQKKAARYDRNGDDHYDVISAFIKSMRGSDPDATVYWLARMLDAGEDIRFIARRIVICASEDVGNASPQALGVAMAAAQAVEFIGMPEARIILSQAAIFLATSPKSNAAYMAINEAMHDVSTGKIHEVPDHLRQGSGAASKSLGHGVGYKYAHSYDNHHVAQEYLPGNKQYYAPVDQGHEKTIKERMAAWRTQRKHSDST